MRGQDSSKTDSAAEPTRAAENEAKPSRLGTKIVDDVFTDAVTRVKPRFEVDYEAYVGRLWEASPDIHRLLKDAADLEDARDHLFSYLEGAERAIFEVDNDLHILEKANVRDSVRVFKSIIGPVNELRTGCSALDYLWKLAREKRGELETEVSAGFLMEFINLFRGIAGNSNIYRENGVVKKGVPDFIRLHGREAAEARTDTLDSLGATVRKYFSKYPSGLMDEVI